ncbi:hypothetical protein MLP_49060 [Microlunatus phosphovorus NM-1]|uniref:O-antigen ligase-related domain-containing protein n=1 Tax=Microlunatus phosphovorus (strain ATCC 700054 / DSM 10555 / JCM 9379 / NBRC 101784 / NCIMB 13414 / VKM Ac-1990 / NM-1) TaxID=1032480 RepID=F5XFY6_MICPN|nr:hypothetical protein MLP_49060 [Microlunatus phosphovorus NM-1]
MFTRVRRPVLLAVIVVALVAYPNDSLSTAVRLANVTPTDLASLALVGVAAIDVLRGRNIEVLRSRIMLCPVLVVGAAGFTTLFSTDPVLSLVAVIRYAQVFLLVPVAVVLVLRTWSDVRILLGTVVGLAAVEGIIGTYQAVTKTGAGYDGETIRAIGTFGIGDQIAIGIVVSCGQIVLLAVALKGRRKHRIYAIAGVALLFVPLLLSLSRGAVLAAVAAAGVMVLSAGFRRALKIGVIAAVLVVLAAPLVASFDSTVGERFTSIVDSSSAPDRSVQDRYDLWRAATRIWQTSPVVGVGLKQFPAYRDSLAPLGTSSGSDQVGADSYVRVQLLSPHNEYLLLLSEQGLLGLGSHLLLLAVLGIRHISRLRQPETNLTDNFLRLVCVGAFSFYAISNLWGDLAGPTTMLYSVFLGIMLRSAVIYGSPLERSLVDDFTSPAKRPADADI